MKRLSALGAVLGLTLCLSVPRFAAAAEGAPSLDDLFSHAQDGIRKAVIVDEKGAPYWNMPLYMGPHYVSQLYLMLKWFGPAFDQPRADLMAKFDQPRFERLLLERQLADGSWYATVDRNLQHGNLDATILNYWALKAMGHSMQSPELMRARAFILSRGGLERATAFTKIYLAMFRQGSWEVVPEVPTFALDPKNPAFMNLSSFAQWVIPHIVPISYLKDRRVAKDLGPSFDIGELRTGPAPVLPAVNYRQDRRLQRRQAIAVPRPFALSERDSVDYMMLRIGSAQQLEGSWGGYTSATLFSLAAYDDYLSVTPERGPEFEASVSKGFHFLQAYYIDSPNAYLGSVCDGRYWDTILILNAMVESGAPVADLAKTGDYLARAVTERGGIPFGFEFEYAPDTDDTAEMVTALAHLDIALGNHRYRPVIDKAIAWIATMQNKDGGWGAFDRNNVGNPVLDAFAAKFKDSAELFDKSSEDVTGHILEAVGTAGLKEAYLPMISRATSYLRTRQVKQGEAAGAWVGRWGVNYLYGTEAVLTGLSRIGMDPRSALMRAGTGWILNHQNADGGFGETTQSYKDIALAGHGRSTASQTAWGLMALVEGGERESAAARRAVQYLLATFDATSESWHDESVVGTGHPGIVYLEYPSYPYAFPLTALSRFRGLK